MPRCTNNEVCNLAARSLRKQVKLLTEHLGGIRQGEEIESLHRTRVASRRLRARLTSVLATLEAEAGPTMEAEIRLLGPRLEHAARS